VRDLEPEFFRVAIKVITRVNRLFDSLDILVFFFFGRPLGVLPRESPF
jgi:hypothetical protein